MDRDAYAIGGAIAFAISFAIFMYGVSSLDWADVGRAGKIGFLVMALVGIFGMLISLHAAFTWGS